MRRRRASIWLVILAALLGAVVWLPVAARADLVRKPIYVDSKGKTVYQYVYSAGRTRFAKKPTYYSYYPYYRRGFGSYRVHHPRPCPHPGPPAPCPPGK